MTAVRKKLFIIDSAFRDVHGHHFRLSKFYFRAASDFDCTLIVHKDCGNDHEISDKFLVRHFSRSYNDARIIVAKSLISKLMLESVRSTGYIKSKNLRKLLNTCFDFYRDMKGKLLKATEHNDPPIEIETDLLYGEIVSLFKKFAFGPQHTLLFPSIDAELGLALVNFLNSIHPDAAPKIVLRFMYSDETYTNINGGYRAFYTELSRCNLLNSKLVLFAETSALAAHLSEIIGIPVGLAPFPAMMDGVAGFRAERSNIVIGFLGGARRERGFEKITLIIEDFHTRFPEIAQNTHWVLHGSGHTDEAFELREQFKRQRLRKFSNVQLRLSYLGDAEYAELLDQIDVIVCPLDQNIFKYRGSGVAQEAIANAKVLICPADISISQYSEPGSIVTAASIEDYSNAVKEIVADKKKFARATQLAKSMYAFTFANSGIIEVCR
jgi:hypothetical protein